MKYLMLSLLLVSVGASASSDSILKALTKTDNVLYRNGMVQDRKYYKGSDPKEVEAAVAKYDEHKRWMNQQNERYAKEYPQPIRYERTSKEQRCMAAAMIMREAALLQGDQFDANAMYRKCIK